MRHGENFITKLTVKPSRLEVAAFFDPGPNWVALRRFFGLAEVVFGVLLVKDRGLQVASSNKLCGGSN